ncbi:hypothetical protein PROFUN_09277 [Planoprotostelium fungivorum]|uniref:THH1/TOM1/TOM3 domain-containing protein n=1 Tax=Planoprotostelium fungivorum TaxID=1890364 RepID=A0A2P6NKW9_9EUKA|nr:hypothetical protein PROFUN_09277 [Planoprotostelium fungivorum]
MGAPSGCAPSCNGYGICQTSGMCRCLRGWVPTVSSDGYSQCITTFLDVGWRGNIIALRVVFSVIYGIQLLLVTWRLVLEFKNRAKSQGLAPPSITRLILAVLWLDVFIQFLNYGIDFKGIFHTANVWAMQTFTYIEAPNLVLMFSILLAYWIDFYQALVTKMKKEHMLRKINSSYQSQVSFEDILVEMSHMRKAKMLMVFLTVFGYAFFASFMLTVRLVTTGKADLYTYVALVTWFAVVWIILGVGFMISGLKLFRLMPEQLTVKITAVAIVLLIANLFSFASNVKSAPGVELFLIKTGIVSALTATARSATSGTPSTNHTGSQKEEMKAADESQKVDVHTSTPV